MHDRAYPAARGPRPANATRSTTVTESWCKIRTGGPRTDAQISAGIDHLLRSQQPDGGWPITWEPPGEAATLEWRGVVTLQALLALTSYGRVSESQARNGRYAKTLKGNTRHMSPRCLAWRLVIHPPRRVCTWTKESSAALTTTSSPRQSSSSMRYCKPLKYSSLRRLSVSRAGRICRGWRRVDGGMVDRTAFGVWIAGSRMGQRHTFAQFIACSLRQVRRRRAHLRPSEAAFARRDGRDRTAASRPGRRPVRGAVRTVGAASAAGHLGRDGGGPRGSLLPLQVALPEAVLLGRG